MKSTFDRSKVIQDLQEIQNLQHGTITDGKDCTREVWRGSGGRFVYANQADMCPQSIEEMADLICESSQSC